MSDFSDAAREYFGGAHRPEPHVPEPEEVTGDEVDGSTNPLADYAESAYLTAAATWLVQAEGHLSLEGTYDGQGFEPKAQWACRLAELNIAMAAACGAYQDRQRPGKTDWLTPTVPAAAIAKTPDEVATEIREQVQADVATHQAETLRPGIDPEPPEDGALWTADGEYFAFAVFPLERVIQRWLIIRRYTEALKWHNDYPNNFITADTWEGLDGKIGYADDAPLRRPTAAERTAFYGPEPEPTADTHVICPKCGAPGRALELGERERRTPENDPRCPPCTVPVPDQPTPMLDAFTDRAGTSLAELDDQQLWNLEQEIHRRKLQRAPHDPGCIEGGPHAGPCPKERR